MSFLRRQESSFFNKLVDCWIPVFTGMTTFYETVKSVKENFVMELQRISLLIRKIDPFWGLVFTFIVISAFLVSDITNRIIESKLHTPAYIPKKMGEGLGFASKREPRKSLLDIVSTTSETQDTPLKREIPFLSTYRLIGTAVGKGGISYAFFENISKRNQIILREGESTEEGIVLKEVLPGRVVLLANDRETTMEIVYEVTDKKGRRKASFTPAARTRSELTKTLNRREVEASLEDLNKVMTQARIIPYMVKGNTEGYRIFAIRPGSIYTKIGLKNGDVIKGINGVNLDSPEKAYQLFQQLKDESRLTLDIMRRNQNITLTVEIG